MNERIKELWKQAGIYDGREGLYWCSQEQLEKFAELVWKAAYEEGHDVGVDAGFEAGRNASFTEQHFGVEE
jgi:hypothetical protein